MWNVTYNYYYNMTIINYNTEPSRVNSLQKDLSKGNS